MPTTPETDPAAFSVRLRESMRDAGIPVRGGGVMLATRHKVSGPTAHGWLNGKHLPETRRVRIMADDYAVNFDWLMWGRGEKTGEVDRERALSLKPTPDTLAIPQLNVSGSMGPGLLAPEHVEVVQGIAVRVSDLRQLVRFSSPSNLRFITGFGDSMTPTYSDGDVLLVDQGITEVKIDAIYVFELGPEHELFIKTLQRVRGTKAIRMISDNKKYEPEVIEDPEKEQMQIRGRVLLAWNAKRL